MPHRTRVLLRTSTRQYVVEWSSPSCELEQKTSSAAAVAAATAIRRSRTAHDLDFVT
jgi:hypothetical protein